MESKRTREASTRPASGLAGSGIENLLLRLRAVPAVPVARHKDGPLVMDATHRALLRG
jgi:hypothetical protein